MVGIGPLMFLIYINDIGEKLLSLSRLFADDTSLGYSSQSVDQIKTVIWLYLLSYFLNVHSILHFGRG
jgi:hypothetical protein